MSWGTWFEGPQGRRVGEAIYRAAATPRPSSTWALIHGWLDL